mmetsp:Transcript_69415/g.199092  ORF Transcript_69415/g.199092 Transcript_69415/m.199092 type:complete len:615 (-) Transcript_69415:81-1925(-)
MPGAWAAKTLAACAAIWLPFAMASSPGDDDAPQDGNGSFAGTTTSATAVATTYTPSSSTVTFTSTAASSTATATFTSLGLPSAGAAETGVPSTTTTSTTRSASGPTIIATSTTTIKPFVGSVRMEVSDTTWFLSGDARVDAVLRPAIAYAHGVGTDDVTVTGVSLSSARLRLLRSKSGAADVGARGRPRRLAAGAIRVDYKLLAGSAVFVSSYGAARAIRDRLESALVNEGLDVVLGCVVDLCADENCTFEACGNETSRGVLEESLQALAPTQSPAPEHSFVYQVEHLIDEYLVPWGILVIGCLVLMVCFCCRLWFRGRRRRRKSKEPATPDRGDDDPPLFPGHQDRSPAVERRDQSSSRCKSCSSSTDTFGAESMFGGAGGTQAACAPGEFTPTGSNSRPSERNEEDLCTPPRFGGGGGGLSSAPFYGGAQGSASKVAAMRGFDSDSRPLDVRWQLEGPEAAILGCQPAAPEISQAALARWVRMVYGRYNPKKLDRVDPMVAEYKGREQELVDAISQKYRLHPSHFERHYSRSAPVGACGACACGAGDGSTGGGNTSALGLTGVLPAPSPAHWPPQQDLVQQQMRMGAPAPAPPAILPPTRSQSASLATAALK